MGDEFEDIDRVEWTITLTDAGNHSIVIDTTETVSGAPPYPRLPALDLPWWRVLERRRIIAMREQLVREWEKAYAAWVADGRPDAEVLVRRYIPNARIEVSDD